MTGTGDAGDLAAYLSDRYDEAEALAKAATEGPWQATGQRDHFVVQAEGDHLVAEMEGCTGHPDMGGRNAAYIVGVDPAHRLADIALKRAILADHGPDERDPELCRTCHVAERGWAVPVPAGWPCATARHLGIEFSKRPDYLAKWKPGASYGG